MTSLKLCSVSVHDSPIVPLLILLDLVRDQQTKEYTGQGFINFKNEEAATAAYTALRQSSHASQFYMRYASPRS